VSDIVGIIGPGRMGLALGSALTQADAIEGLIYFGRLRSRRPTPCSTGTVR
jgi:predicted dinucleotide-binding enzyme